RVLSVYFSIFMADISRSRSHPLFQLPSANGRWQAWHHGGYARLTVLALRSAANLAALAAALC
ncbi:MAG TPA: hypothetical protein VHT48_09055, partial [Methylocella sp.]|nr:hypothetical protein [Methylocella sp.]